MNENIFIPKKSVPSKIASLGLLWLFLTGAGLWFLSDYQNTPGIATAPPVQFPAESRLARNADRPTLVMLVHPHCPCSRASIGELELVAAQTQRRATIYVLFLKPSEFTEDWEKTDLWKNVSEIPGVKAVSDTDGKEAALFNGATSGQTFLYAADGHLLFKGGITDGRGHSGDNAGRSAVVAFLNEDKTAQTETEVYGCPLFNKDTFACPLPQ